MEGQCAFCGLSNQVRICKNPDTGKGPQFCSTLLYPECIETVSYTHLDVYKRQASYCAGQI